MCILCHWAVRAGLTGFAEYLAMPPGIHESKYSEMVKRVIGLNAQDERLTKLKAPGLAKLDVERRLHDIFVIPAHEALSDEVCNSKEPIAARVQDAITGQE